MNRRRQRGILDEWQADQAPRYAYAVRSARPQRADLEHGAAGWLFEKSEERVRQEFLRVPAAEHGYAVEQIGEEEDMTGRASAQARADHLVWRSARDKAERKRAASQFADRRRAEAERPSANARALLEAALRGTPLPESVSALHA